MSKRILSYRPEVQLIVGGENITNHLGDGGSVRVTKGLYSPTGEFQVALPDRPTPYRDSLYGQIEVMAPIEIKMRRWDERGISGPWVHVLRGFVRSVGRDEQVDREGRVQRQVVLSGHDCGSALIMEQMSTYVAWQNAGVPAPAPLLYLREFELSGQPYEVSDFIWQVAKMASESILAARRHASDEAAFTLIPVFSVTKGYVFPHTAMSMQGAVWEMLRRYADAPWNELFIREGVAGPELVFRPTPWFDIDDNPLPDVVASTVSGTRVHISDIMSLTAHRDDVELVNHAWVKAPWASASANVQPLLIGRGLLNPETRATFGDRIQIKETALGPMWSPTGLPMEEQKQANSAWGDWILDRLKWLVAAGEQTHRFERGRVTMKGRPELRVGDYLEVERPAFLWSGYVTAISHEFIPFQVYRTSVEYIRGNQWVRRQLVPNPWDKERMESLM